jgi:MYXO-CTERM domain-containing protein
MCDGLNSVKCVETAPVNVEVCNGRDDDCNGIVDDAPGCPHPDAGSGADADPSIDGGDDGGGDDAPIVEDAGVDATGGRTGRQPHDAGTDAARPRSGSGCSCAVAPSAREGAPLVGVGLAVALAVVASRKRR